jgi:hypothetical protein
MAYGVSVVHITTVLGWWGRILPSEGVLGYHSSAFIPDFFKSLNSISLLHLFCNSGPKHLLSTYPVHH